MHPAKLTHKGQIRLICHGLLSSDVFNNLALDLVIMALEYILCEEIDDQSLFCKSTVNIKPIDIL